MLSTTFESINSASAGAPESCLINAFSVDVEEHFQVEAFAGLINRLNWDDQPSRAALSTGRVLDVLAAAGVKGTFFVLGWVAERIPDLVRRIAAEGHEIASHGYDHRRLTELTPAEFREDARHAKRLIEDCTGQPVKGFRAPTFSINSRSWWAYELLAEEGYRYSSSVYPIKHDLYGMPEAPRTVFAPLPKTQFLEIPIATVRLMGGNRPCGGGGYFRLMPYGISRRLINRLNGVERLPCVFYCHPWEFDLEQPHFTSAPLKSKVRHYLNIGKMESRIRKLLSDFRWGRMDEIFLVGANWSAGN